MTPRSRSACIKCKMCSNKIIILRDCGLHRGKSWKDKSTGIIVIAKLSNNTSEYKGDS